MSETATRGATPESAQAAAVIPAEAPAAPASSLQQSQADIMKQIAEAKTPAAIRALTEKLRPAMEQTLRTGTPPEAPKPEEVAKPTAETAPEAETPAEETPETPTAEETLEAAAEEPAATDQPETDPEAEGPLSIPTAKQLRARLNDDDKVGRLAMSLKQRNRDWTLEQSIQAARERLGIKPEGAKAEPDAPAPNAHLPQTVDAVDAMVAQLRAERKKHYTELKFEEGSDITDKIEGLMLHRIELERNAERSQAKQAQAYDAGFTASQAKAAELYDFTTKPDSAGAKRMMEIESDLEANDDPLFHSPDKPLKIAQMVAAELGIAPKRKGAPAAPAKAAAPAVAPAAKKQVLPTGGSRTTAPAVNQQPAIIPKIQAVRSIGDLRKLNKELGIPY